MSHPAFAGGHPRLLRLAARWRRRRALAAALRVAALALPAAAVAWSLPLPTAARAALAAACALLLGGLAARRLAATRTSLLADVARHLDRTLPTLEESAELLLVSGPLAPIASLQRERVTRRMLDLDAEALRAALPHRGLQRGSLALLGGATLAALVLLLPRTGARPTSLALVGAGAGERAAATPLLGALAVTVQPPAYTGRPARQVGRLDLAAEEGSLLTWRVEAAAPVDAVWLLLDERERLPLAAAGAGGAFTASRQAREPALLRLVLASGGRELWRSPPARLEVIPDRPPTVELVAPAPLVERDAARAGALTLELAVADDYGVRDGALLVTLATGTDEQVQFRDQRLPLPLRRRAAAQAVHRRLDLAALGLVAGSELYLRAEVRDERGQLTRAPTVIVRAPGEGQESAALDAGIPLLLPPELLRSQRQIVIDTERLIAELPRLAASEVARRAQTLALDQRALRFRYGALLGEEFADGRALGAGDAGAYAGGRHGEREPHEGEDETGAHPAEQPIQAEDEIDHAHAADAGAVATGEGPPADGGRAAVIGAFGHLHDSAEANTYFPPAVRQRLKAMLAAMWAAEGELGIVQPRSALPHELRALALLKEVQQASRVYVRRAGVAGAPLDPARRHTGELEEVTDLFASPAELPPEPTVVAARAALSALAGAGDAGSAAVAAATTSALALPAATVATLRAAFAARARAGDGAALAALPALDELAAGRRLDAPTRTALERALWALLPAPAQPVRREAEESPLWEHYRAALEEGR